MKKAFATFAYRDFRFYLLVKFLVTIAIQAQTVIVGWQLYKITKDPLSLGLSGLAEFVPAISVALYAGHLADKYSRKLICILSYLGIFLSMIFLTYFSYHSEILLEQIGTMPIYLAVFMIGLSRGFLSPSSSALMSQLVPREMYLNSSTWNSNIWQTGAIIGPAIGGILFASIGVVKSYAFCAILLAISILLFTMIRYTYVKSEKNNTEKIKDRLLSGIHFVFKERNILNTITLDLFAVLFGGAVALLPIFASDILKTGPEGLGILRAAPSVGSAIMALFLAFYPPYTNAGKKLLWAIAGFGLCMIFFALSTVFWLSVVLLAISGALDNVSVVIRSTILQVLTPDDMRGRVSAVNSMFVNSSNELGAFESGVTAKLFGTIPAVIFGGTMTLFVVGIVSWKAPSLRKLNILHLLNNQP